MKNTNKFLLLLLITTVSLGNFRVFADSYYSMNSLSGVSESVWDNFTKEVRGNSSNSNVLKKYENIINNTDNAKLKGLFANELRGISLEELRTNLSKVKQEEDNKKKKQQGKKLLKTKKANAEIKETLEKNIVQTKIVPTNPYASIVKTETPNPITPMITMANYENGQYLQQYNNQQQPLVGKVGYPNYNYPLDSRLVSKMSNSHVSNTNGQQAGNNYLYNNTVTDSHIAKTQAVNTHGQNQQQYNNLGSTPGNLESQQQLLDAYKQEQLFAQNVDPNKELQHPILSDLSGKLQHPIFEQNKNNSVLGQKQNLDSISTKSEPGTLSNYFGYYQVFNPIYKNILREHLSGFSSSEKSVQNFEQEIPAEDFMMFDAFILQEENIGRVFYRDNSQDVDSFPIKEEIRFLDFDKLKVNSKSRFLSQTLSLITKYCKNYLLDTNDPFLIFKRSEKFYIIFCEDIKKDRNIEALEIKCEINKHGYLGSTKEWLRRTALTAGLQSLWRKWDSKKRLGFARVITTELKLDKSSGNGYFIFATDDDFKNHRCKSMQVEQSIKNKIDIILQQRKLNERQVFYIDSKTIDTLDLKRNFIGFTSPTEIFSKKFQTNNYWKKFFDSKGMQNILNEFNKINDEVERSFSKFNNNDSENVKKELADKLSDNVSVFSSIRKPASKDQLGLLNYYIEKGYAQIFKADTKTNIKYAIQAAFMNYFSPKCIIDCFGEKCKLESIKNSRQHLFPVFFIYKKDKDTNDFQYLAVSFSCPIEELKAFEKCK